MPVSKFTTVSRDVSVLKVYKFFLQMFQEENFAVCISKDVSYNMKTDGKAFSWYWLFIYPLDKKRTVPLGENSCKRN